MPPDSPGPHDRPHDPPHERRAGARAHELPPLARRTERDRPLREPPPAAPPLHPLAPQLAVRIALGLFAAATAYRFFPTLSRVALLVYAAAILAVALHAVASRLPLRRRWSAVVVGLALLAALGAALWFGGSALVGQASALAGQLPLIEERVNALGEQAAGSVGLEVNDVAGQLRGLVSDWLGGLGGGEVVSRAMSVVGALAAVVLVLFGGVFALAKPNDHLLVPLLRLVRPERRPVWRRFLALLAHRLRGWVKGQLISMLTIAVLATAAFYVIGVPYALLLGVINGVAEFVPIVGPWVGGLPAVLLAFFDDPQKGLWTAVAILAIQQLESQLITPLVMSRAAEVHPFVTLFAILLFGGLFGFLGVLLALPLVLLVWTAVEVFWVDDTLDTRDERLRPVVPD